jgi:UDP-glucose 4-epimerase
MRVLVTGGAGFIGSHIVDRLIEGGHAVTVLDNLSTGRSENLPPGVTFLQGDVTDPRLVRGLSGARFDAVVHQAAQVSVPRSLDDPLLDAQVNLVGTMQMLEVARESRARRFVFASSAAVYGEPAIIPTTEDAPTDPRSPYAASKLAAEQYLRRSQHRSELDVVVLRYANVYGPRQTAHGEAGVVCAFIVHRLNGWPLPIHGDGQQTRDFIYVEDVVEANCRALQPGAPPGVYNVGSGQAVRVLDLAAWLGGAGSPRAHLAPRPGDVRHSALDCAAIRRAMGWQPIVSLGEGLARTWEHFAQLADEKDRAGAQRHVDPLVSATVGFAAHAAHAA